MTKRLQIIRALLLLAAMSAGVLVWEWIAGRVKAAESQAAIANHTAHLEAELAFVMPVQGGYAATGEYPMPLFGLNWIEFAEKEDNGPDFALFLPAAAQTIGLQAFLGGITLRLDGEPLTNGQQLTLTAGEHLLAAEDGPIPGKEWDFVVMYGSEIPCMFIETASGSMDAIYEDKKYGESAAVTLLNADGSLEYTGSIEAMHGHGNVTWVSEKKSYQIALSQKASLLGMPLARRWLLIGNVFDKSLLRNQVAFSIAQEAGLPFTPESRQAELYINGMYFGCYLLCEKIGVGENRVDVPDLDKANQLASAGAQSLEEVFLRDVGIPGQPGHYRYAQLTGEVAGSLGGYLLEYDLPERYLDGRTVGFVTRMGQPVSIKSPAFPSQAQVEYVAELCQRLEDLLYPPLDGDPAGALDEVIDLHSFAQKYLIEEITKNMDANVSSQYLYKMSDNVDSRLFAGPVWDYDTALGSAGNPWEDISEFNGPEGFWANQQQTDYSLWAGLYQQPVFREAVRESFFEEFTPAVRKILDENWISADGSRLIASARMDALRRQGVAYDQETFDREYLQDVSHIEDFLTARMEFLKGEWQDEAGLEA